MISARNLSKRFGVKRVFDRVDVELARGDFLLVTGPNGAGKTTLLRVLAGLAAPTKGELELPDRARRRLPRPRAARLPRADAAREPPPVRPALPRARPRRADRDAARAVRPLGGARPARLDVLARDAAAARALPRAAARPGPARPRRAVQRARRRRRRAARPHARGARRAAPVIVATHDPGRVAAPRDRRGWRSRDATSATSPRWRARTCCSSCGRRRRCRRCCCSSSRRSRSSTSRVPGGTWQLATLGLLWIALIFTALLGLTRAFVPEREQQTMDALVLAPCDRSAIWLAKSIAVFAFLVAGGARRAARVLALLLERSTAARSPRSCSRTSASAPSARSPARWPSPAVRAS